MIEMQRLDKLRVIVAEWEKLTCQQCGLVAIDIVHRGLKY
jgi:hypothetical protein